MIDPSSILPTQQQAGWAVSLAGLVLTLIKSKREATAARSLAEKAAAEAIAARDHLLTTLVGRLEKLETDVERLRSTRDDLIVLADRLTARCGTLQADIDRLRLSADALDKQVSALTLERDQLRAKVAELQPSLPLAVALTTTLTAAAPAATQETPAP